MKTPTWRKGTPVVLMIRVGSRGLSLVSTIALTRLLGGHGYGVYAYALAWVTLLTLPTTVGLDRLLVRYTATYEVQGRPDLLKGLIHRAERLILVFSVCAGALAAAIATIGVSHVYLTALFVGLAIVPIASLSQISQFVVQGLRHPELSLVPNLIVTPIVMIALLLGSRAVGIRLTPVLAVTFGLVAASVALLLILGLRRKFLQPIVRSSAASFAVGEWLRSLAPFTAVALIFTASSQVGVILLGWLSTPDEVGTFQITVKVAQLISLVLLAINTSLMPELARHHAAGRQDALRAAASRASRHALIYSLPVAIVLVSFKGLIPTVFGSEFDAGGLSLTVLAAAQLCSAAVGSAGAVLLMTGHAGTMARYTGLALALDFVLCLVLIPPLGASGAAIASATDLAVWNIGLGFAVWRALGINTSAFGGSSGAVGRSG